MDIYSKEGTRVKVTEDSIKNGYKYVEEHAMEFLEVGGIYTIDHTEVDRWTTAVYLKEFPGEIFNSVSFESVCDNRCGSCEAMVNEECDYDGHEVYEDTEACDKYGCRYE